MAERLAPPQGLWAFQPWGNLLGTRSNGCRLLSLVSMREMDPSPRASRAHREGFKLGRKGEGDAMRLARVKQVVWGFGLDPMREESQARRDKETLWVAGSSEGIGRGREEGVLPSVLGSGQIAESCV